MPRALQELPPFSHIHYELHIQHLGHGGVGAFLSAFGPNPHSLLQCCVAFVAQTFYDDIPRDMKPKVENISLILRPMPGIAYTSGTDTHKEIHFSLDYIDSLHPLRAAAEIEGVIMHEIVHCFQYNAQRTCPGGLIEGIADFVRLRANLAPPHWRKEKNCDWDTGYERTGYFLDWVETRQANAVGSSSSFVKDLNLAMRDRKFDTSVFADLTGLSLNELWELYGNAD